MGQVGFGGSTRLGDYVVVASQSGISDHLKLGNQVMIGAKSGVMRDIEDGGEPTEDTAAPACLQLQGALRGRIGLGYPQ